MKKKPPRGPSHRQLRVGEILRHALSRVFLEGRLYEAEIRGVSITVSEVQVTPDLKYATAYVMPLHGVNEEKVVSVLNLVAETIRRDVTSRIELRYSPKIRFELDRTFEIAHRINTLLQKDKNKEESGDVAE